MNRLIKGENLIAQINIADQWYDLLCAKSWELSLEQDELSVTSVNSGSNREFIPGFSSAMFTMNGITTIDNTEDKIAITYLMQQSIRRQILGWRVTMEADDGTTLQAGFNGMIKSTSLVKDGFAYADANLSVRVSGNIDYSDIIESPPTTTEVFSDYWQTVNGQNYISGASSGEYNGGTPLTLAATDTILEVRVEGTNFNEVTGTPTPGEAEFLFATSPVRVVFPTSLVFDGTQRVFVMFKRDV